MPTPVKVASLQGYALVSTPAAMRVGSLQGYALVRTPNLPNFSLTGQVALLAALNKQYLRSFTASQISFGPPQVLANDPDYNTTTLLTPNRTSGYSGTRTMRYNRVDIALAVQGKDPAIPTSGMGSTVWTSLAALNTKYGLSLTTADVVDKSIAGQTGISIVAADTSVFFIPGSSFRLGTSIPTMIQVFSTLEMTNPLTIEAGKTAQDSLKTVFLSTVSAAGVGVVKADFSMEDPVVITGVKNTSVKLNAVNLTAVTGSQTLRYDRRPLDSIASLFTTDIVLPDTDTTVSALLAQLNTMSGLLFEPRDFVDSPVSRGVGEVVLEAAATSYAFLPGTTLTLTTGIPSLASITPVTDLDGFRLDTLAEACSVTDLDGFDAA